MSRGGQIWCVSGGGGDGGGAAAEQYAGVKKVMVWRDCNGACTVDVGAVGTDCVDFIFGDCKRKQWRVRASRRYGFKF